MEHSDKRLRDAYIHDQKARFARQPEAHGSGFVPDEAGLGVEAMKVIHPRLG
jgi:hypothetical protein